MTHFRVAEYYDRPARPLVHLLIEGGHRQSRRPATCAGRLRRAEAYACQRQLITRLLLVHGMAAVEKAVVNHVKPNREFSLLEMRRFFCVLASCVGLTGVLFPLVRDIESLQMKGWATPFPPKSIVSRAQDFSASQKAHGSVQSLLANDSHLYANYCV